jgi:hypothetical protein
MLAWSSKVIQMVIAWKVSPNEPITFLASACRPFRCSA